MRTLRELFSAVKIEGSVRHELRSFNSGMLRPGKIQSVKELALRIGLDVHLVELPKRMAGRLVSDPFSTSGYCVEVNKSHSITSRRFAVLHEIGHFLRHVDRADPLFDGLNLNRGDEEFYYDLQQEHEANEVADVLLFGDGALLAATTLHGGDNSKIAKFFGVSENMVVVAMRKFGVRR